MAPDQTGFATPLIAWFNVVEVSVTLGEQDCHCVMARATQTILPPGILNETESNRIS